MVMMAEITFYWCFSLPSEIKNVLSKSKLLKNKQDRGRAISGRLGNRLVSKDSNPPHPRGAADPPSDEDTGKH